MISHALWLRFLIYPVLLSVACSDNSGPAESPASGTFDLAVRGPVTLDLSGTAIVYPGLTSGSIERILLLSSTTAFFYRLEIVFVPPRTSPSGSFAVAAGSPVQATFFIVDRSTNTVSQIAAAQSGTVTLTQSCTIDVCRGSVAGQFPLGSTVQLSAITASFHARLQ